VPERGGGLGDRSNPLEYVPKEKGSGMNVVIDCLKKHRTIRAFTPEVVAPEILEAILEAGMRAATGGYFQPYSLIVIDERETLAVLASYTAPVAVLAVVDHYRFQRYLELHDAAFPVNSPLNFLLAYWDAVIALQNAVIAAESLGLGTVYIGDVARKDLRQMLSLPEDVFPAGLVLIGHPAQEPELRQRLPSEAVVHRNRYQPATEEQMRAWYRRYEEIFERQFANLSDEDRLEQQSAGVVSGIQKLCRDMGEFFESTDALVLANMRRAGFEVETWAQPGPR
jgi:FMN reductase (NADPH)